METNEKKPEAPAENPAMGQIVGYLKDYPFLLITIAGLLILSGILIFDIEKLKEFKWLIYAVVLVPLAIQFLIEFKRMRPAQSAPAVPQPSAIPGVEPIPPVATRPSPSKKAWASVIIGMLLFGIIAATPENELHDHNFALGLLVLSLVAVGLGLYAMADIKRQLASGKGTAITGLMLGVLLALASLGWMSEEAGDSGKAIASGADSATLFTVSSNLGRDGEAEELEATIRIFIEGRKAAEFILDSRTPSQAISIEVPDAGKYRYMIEGFSLWNITRGKRIPLRGVGMIDVKSGATFDIQADSAPSARMQTWNVSLQQE